MRFLFDTVAMRRRRMEWEDMLLMATRCLLIALLALALARPFVPPDSNVPWIFVLPLALLGNAPWGKPSRWYTVFAGLYLDLPSNGILSILV